MNTVERIKAICEARKIPISRLERDCGFGNGYFRQLKKIPDDRLARVAEYLDVSADYLISGEKQKKPVSNGDELLEVLEAYREREEMRMLFKATKKATPNDIRKAVAIIEALINNE